MWAVVLLIMDVPMKGSIGIWSTNKCAGDFGAHVAYTVVLGNLGKIGSRNPPPYQNPQMLKSLILYKVAYSIVSPLRSWALCPRIQPLSDTVDRLYFCLEKEEKLCVECGIWSRQERVFMNAADGWTSQVEEATWVMWNFSHGAANR